MKPVVAVIAPGAMGAAVGKRLTEQGLRVLTVLDGRSPDSVKRAAARISAMFSTVPVLTALQST